MKKIKDKKIIILVVVLAVFSIAYFIVVNKISYAFDNNYDLNAAYNTRLETITTCAIAYGKANLDNFNEEGLMYITVQMLIDNNYLIPSVEGNVNNYLNNSESLNNKKIRIKNDKNIITAEIYS